MKSYATVAAAIATFAAGLVLGVLGTYLFKGKNGTIEEANVTIEQIKEVAKLATIDYIGSVNERVTEGHKWYEWKSAELFVEIHGTVEGQINLEKISMERSGEKKTIVTIKIPQDAIVILDPIIDPEKGIEVTTLRNPNLFHQLTDRQRNDAVNHAIVELKQKAIDGGIKEKTLAEAKQVITQFLARSAVEVKFSN